MIGITEAVVKNHIVKINLLKFVRFKDFNDVTHNYLRFILCLTNKLKGLWSHHIEILVEQC